MARARLTVDLDAIADNWRMLDALSGPHVTTGAVVKADAYGLGAAQVAPALAAAGATHFFVALAEEAATLRHILGPGPNIYVLSGLLPGDSSLCRARDLVPCLNSLAQVERFRADLAGHRCVLQVDTGMNRLGVEPTEVAAAREELAALNPLLIMSHLACSDAPGALENTAQSSAFDAVTRYFPGHRRSLAATGGILLGPAFHHDLTRPGIGLFGGAPFTDARPVVRLSLPVIQVREVETGEFVGYGASWTAQRPSRIATLSAGYADGLLRAVGNARPGTVSVFAGRTACPIVGRVSMDLITADVTDLSQVPEQLDILCADQGIDTLAEAAGTIGYEILTSLGGRYDRQYKDGPLQPDRE